MCAHVVPLQESSLESLLPSITKRSEVEAVGQAFLLRRLTAELIDAKMAAYGEDLGNQIFISLRKGNNWPPNTFDLRVRYEQTIGDIKRMVCSKLGLPMEKLQLFWHKKELTAAYDDKMLLDMNMHTGFSLQGYDLTEEPIYWPEVIQTNEGLQLKC